MVDDLSLKWIDGNSDPTGETQAENPTFNVDNPVMWPPLSVISGLASGFCERKAELDPVAGETFNWTIGAATGQAALVNSGLVATCVANIASGITDGSLFANASPVQGNPIGSADTTEVGNYMTAMDAAITSLISRPSGTRYVAKNGTPYTFNTLATAATALATAAGSSFDESITSNGTDFCQTFKLALPAEWAVQRKWMLETLKYVGGAMELAPAYLRVNGKHTSEATVQKLDVDGAIYDRYPELDGQASADNKYYFGWTKVSGAGESTLLTEELTGNDVAFSTTLSTYSRDSANDFIDVFDNQTLYAWTNENDETLYTYREVPNVGDYVYEQTGSEYPTVAEFDSSDDSIKVAGAWYYLLPDMVNSMYAWSYNPSNPSALVVYTTSNPPAAGDPVYDSSGNQIEDRDYRSTGTQIIEASASEITLRPGISCGQNGYETKAITATIACVEPGQGGTPEAFTRAPDYDSHGRRCWLAGAVKKYTDGDYPPVIGGTIYTQTYDANTGAYTSSDPLEVVSADIVGVEQGVMVASAIDKNSSDFTSSIQYYSTSACVLAVTMQHRDIYSATLEPAALLATADTNATNQTVAFAGGTVTFTYLNDVYTRDTAHDEQNSYAWKNAADRVIRTTTTSPALYTYAMDGTTEFTILAVEQDNITAAAVGESRFTTYTGIDANRLVLCKERSNEANVYDARVIDSYGVSGYSVTRMEIGGASLPAQEVTVSVFLGYPDFEGNFLDAYANNDSLQLKEDTTLRHVDIDYLRAKQGTVIVESGITTAMGCAITSAIVCPGGTLNLVDDTAIRVYDSDDDETYTYYRHPQIDGSVSITAGGVTTPTAYYGWMREDYGDYYAVWATTSTVPAAGATVYRCANVEETNASQPLPSIIIVERIDETVSFPDPEDSEYPEGTILIDDDPYVREPTYDTTIAYNGTSTTYCCWSYEYSANETYYRWLTDATPTEASYVYYNPHIDDSAPSLITFISYAVTGTTVISSFVDDCCIMKATDSEMDDGIVLGAYTYENTGTENSPNYVGHDHVSRMYYDCDLIYSADNDPTKPVVADTTYTGATGSTALSHNSVVVMPGVTCTVQACRPTSAYFRVMSGGKLILNETTANKGAAAGEINILPGGEGLFSGHGLQIGATGNNNAGGTVHVRTGASCTVIETGNTVATHLYGGAYVHSGGTLTINSNTAIGFENASYKFFYGLTVTDGAVVRVATGTDPDNLTILNTAQDILNYKAHTDGSLTECAVYKFFDHGLVLKNTNTPIHYGWNVATLSLPTQGAYDVFASSATAKDPPIVTQPLYLGTTNNDHKDSANQTYWEDSTVLNAGYVICMVKAQIAGVGEATDKYTDFMVRQFATNPDNANTPST